MLKKNSFDPVHFSCSLHTPHLIPRTTSCFADLSCISLLNETNPRQALHDLDSAVSAIVGSDVISSETGAT